MGYAFIAFVTMLMLAVVVVTAVSYGIEKEGSIAPLKAENDYAEREAGKAQTGLTIVNTCLSESSRYINTVPGQTGPLILHLTVRNNGSHILNPNKATVLYNTSYSNFTVTSGEVWSPLKNASLQVRDLLIAPNIPEKGPEIRLLVAAENGISAIAPTTPINFTGKNFGNTTFEFRWNASKDDKRVNYYLIYKFEENVQIQCPKTPDLIVSVAGNKTSMIATIPCPPPCKNKFFYMTAVDVDGNMGVPSRTLNCPGAADMECGY